MSVLPVYIYTVHTWCLHSQKSVLDPLELELEVVVSHYVGIRN